MKFRVLSAFPALFVAIVFLALHFAQSSPAYASLLKGEITLVKLAAVIGCLSAARALERGEHLRRAWFLLAFGTGLFLVRDAVGELGPASPALLGIPAAEVRATLLVAANVINVVGVWQMAQTFRLADIELPGSARKRTLILGTAAVLALLISGPALWTHVLGIGRGVAEAIPDLIANSCDLVSFCFIAPVLLTALAFRGGVLYFPWALLAASQIGWLLFDTMDILGGRLPLAPATVLTVTEIFRAIACVCTCAAGLAQRAVVTHETKESLETAS